MKRALAPIAAAALLGTGCAGASSDAKPTVTETVTTTVTVEPEAAEPEPSQSTKVENEPEAAPDAEGTTAATDPAIGQSETSARGNLIKQMGEPAGLIGSNGEPFVTFTVHSISQGQCTEPMSEAPENGHFIFLDVSVETSPVLVDEYGTPFSLVLGWKAIGPEGQTSNATLDTFAAFTCLPDRQTLPSELGPAEQARATIVLDTPYPQGTLVYQDMMYPETGWEWEYSTQ